MKNRFSLWAVCLLATTMLLLPQAAHAQCTLASFSGTYEFDEAGVPPGSSTVNVGVLVADGAGHFTVTQDSYSGPLPGGILPVPGAFLVRTEQNQGTYQVNPDCTMSLTFHPSIYENPPRILFPIHFDAVLVKGGAGFYMIDSDPGLLGSGVGKKI